MKKIEKVPFPPPQWVTESLGMKVLQFAFKASQFVFGDDTIKHDSEFNCTVLPVLKRYNISIVKRVYPD